MPVLTTNPRFATAAAPTSNPDLGGNNIVILRMFADLSDLAYADYLNGSSTPLGARNILGVRIFGR